MKDNSLHFGLSQVSNLANLDHADKDGATFIPRLDIAYIAEFFYSESHTMTSFLSCEHYVVLASGSLSSS